MKKNGQKVGRNDPCPCSSGKKFKRCHGNEGSRWRLDSNENMPEDIKKLFKRDEVLDIQREKQQGLGNPIIASKYRDGLAVALGSEVTIYPKAKTFHEVLLTYLWQVLGKEWLRNEISLKENVHPIARWYLAGLEQVNGVKAVEGLTVKSTRMTSALQAQFGLAWNLFNIQSNLEIQKKLIKRLMIKDRDMSNFMGALYETYVIAAFIKAGFKVELEDESDGSTTHGEFIATHSSGKKYMVEAKTKLTGSSLMSYMRNLRNALSKTTSFERIIFLGFNEPEITEDMALEIQTKLFKRENKIQLADGKPAPPAYLIFTNHAFHSDIESNAMGFMFFPAGFKIPDFPAFFEMQGGVKYVENKKRDRPLYELMKSMLEHFEIPSTIDGQLPEFAYAENPEHRLLVGNKYEIDYNGEMVVGTLKTGTVIPEKKEAWCSMFVENHGNMTCKIPLTDIEVSAYYRSPNTFFGEVIPQGGKVDSPTEFFDFLFKTYKNSPRDFLLEEISKLTNNSSYLEKSQEELAALYCEAAVQSQIRANVFKTTNKTHTVTFSL